MSSNASLISLPSRITCREWICRELRDVLLIYAPGTSAPCARLVLLYMLAAARWRHVTLFCMAARESRKKKRENVSADGREVGHTGALDDSRTGPRSLISLDLIWKFLFGRFALEVGWMRVRAVEFDIVYRGAGMSISEFIFRKLLLKMFPPPSSSCGSSIKLLNNSRVDIADDNFKI